MVKFGLNECFFEVPLFWTRKDTQFDAWSRTYYLERKFSVYFRIIRPFPLKGNCAYYWKSNLNWLNSFFQFNTLQEIMKTRMEGVPSNKSTVLTCLTCWTTEGHVSNCSSDEETVPTSILGQLEAVSLRISVAYCWKPLVLCVGERLRASAPKINYFL